MRNFGSIKNFIQVPLLRLIPRIIVPVMPGPNLPDIPGAFILLTRYGGDGFELDGALDTYAWQVRCVGKQNDYDSAERLADAVDHIFTDHRSSRIDGWWVPSIQRVGGAPSVLMKDSAERTHFICSYMTDIGTIPTPITGPGVSDGARVFEGHGPPPDDLGWILGDYYINLDTGDLYWNDPASSPTNGVRIFEGHGPPPSGLGWVAGDYYIDVDNGDLYRNE